MAIVQIKNNCNKCGMKVYQWVTYRRKKGKIEIEAYQDKCPTCQGFLQRPTPEKVKVAVNMREKK